MQIKLAVACMFDLCPRCLEFKRLGTDAAHFWCSRLKSCKLLKGKQIELGFLPSPNLSLCILDSLAVGISKSGTG